MKRIVTVLLCLLCTFTAVGEERDSLLVVFWNLENFFDYTDGGGGSSDAEFSATGPRRWTRKRFWTKCNAVAKTLLWIADREGRLPDAVGFAEIENEFVLRSLVRSTALSSFGYSYVHYDSPDPRGIDVGLIYRKDAFSVLSSRPHAVNGSTTRDILEVRLQGREKDTLNILVNHHPSKYGGSSSSARRVGAMETMRSIVENLGGRMTLAMGDFNDTPDGEAFELMEGTMVNLAEPLAARGEGTIRFEGKWELIDMFMVTPDLVQNSEMKIAYPPFIMTRDSAHSGEKPLRTYSGPRYLGGVSDHLPVVVRLGY